VSGVLLRPLLGLLVLGSGGCSRPPEFNVLLISVDTLAHPAIPGFGQSAAALPRLSGFVAASRSFTRACSTASWTLPAHASLLTGLYPDRHGAIHPALRMGSDLPTLAEQLREAGMETVAFTDGGYLDAAYGFDRGFDRYDTRVARGSGSGPTLPRGGAPEAVHGESLFDRALAWLETRNPDTAPFFLFLQTYAVHDYYRLHPWATEGLEEPPRRNDEELYEILVGKRRGTEEDWAALRELYAREVAHLDAALGRLLALLEERGLASSTYVILVSDHGEGFEPRRGRIHHGGRLHADQLRIPLVVCGPGIPPGEESHPVSLVDLPPTILELLDVEPEGDLDGVSFAGLLRGGAEPPGRPLFAFEYYMSWSGGRRREPTTFSWNLLGAAVIEDSRWWIRDGSGEQLYDMGKDPAQEHNLAAKAEDRQNLASRLEQRGPRIPPLNPGPGNEALTESLRALGYLDS
jgi:arylsulfatase A-like enzyme